MIILNCPPNCRWLIAKEKSLAMPVLPKCGSSSLKYNPAFHPHVSVKEVLIIPERIAWIRQPIDRLYSCWCNFVKGTNHNLKEVGTGKGLTSWEQFIDLILEGELNVHWNPQVPQLTYQDVYVPTISERFENLPVKFNHYLSGTLGHINASDPRTINRSYRIKEVQDKYKEDLDLWESIS